MLLKEIGKFSRTHGIKGQLVLQLNDHLGFTELKAIFLDSLTGKAPFFVQDLNDTPQGIIIKLEEVDNLETARNLLNKPVYAEASVVEEEESDDLVGYELIDANYGSLGHVLQIAFNGQQDLASVRFKDADMLLPLVDAFITGIDEEKKQIHYQAPAGLIELYLEEGREE